MGTKACARLRHSAPARTMFRKTKLPGIAPPFEPDAIKNARQQPLKSIRDPGGTIAYRPFVDGKPTGAGLPGFGRCRVSCTSTGCPRTGRIERCRSPRSDHPVAEKKECHEKFRGGRNRRNRSGDSVKNSGCRKTGTGFGHESPGRCAGHFLRQYSGAAIPVGLPSAGSLPGEPGSFPTSGDVGGRARGMQSTEVISAPVSPFFGPDDTIS
jgi:hypothetical protein